MSQIKEVDAGPASDTDFRTPIYDRYRQLGIRRDPAPGAAVPTSPYIEKVIRDHVPARRDARILELGCGDGTFIRSLRAAGYLEVAGIDRSPEQVALAERIGTPGVRVGDVFDEIRATPDASLDVVIAFDLLEHLRREEILGLADEVYRVLRPGGRWLLHVPNAESPMFGRIRYGDATHEQAFTWRSLRQLLLPAGFGALTFHEDAPIAHSIASAARLALWKVIRAGLRFYVAVETGDLGRSSIYSLGLLAVARK